MSKIQILLSSATINILVINERNFDTNKLTSKVHNNNEQTSMLAITYSEKFDDLHDLNIIRVIIRNIDNKMNQFLIIDI